MTFDQQPPPGWLTSTAPRPGVAGSSTGEIAVEVATVRPPRMTVTVTGPSLSAQPVEETKSRCGKGRMEWVPVGGSLTLTARLDADRAERLAAESNASMEYS